MLGPIFIREWLTLPRRPQHYFTRALYLGALWSDKTFQALAMTVLFLVLYLCLTQALALAPRVLASFADSVPMIHADTMQYWQTTFDPFAALAEVIDPPEKSEGPSAAVRFAIAMLILSALLNGIGIMMLRVWNPSGEPIMQREVIGAAPIDPANPDRIHAAPGKARPVWANPIMWREIATRAYGRRPLLVKIAYFVVLALVC